MKDIRNKEQLLLHEAYISRRKKPVNLQAGDEFIFAKEFEREINATELLEFRNTILSYDGLLVKKMTVLPECIKNKTIYNELKFRYPLKLRLRQHRTSLSAEPPYMCIHNYYWLGYFHWMTEVLTRLAAIEHLLPNRTLVLPEPRQEFHKITIEAFRIGRVAYLKPNEYARFQELQMPSFTAPPGNYNAKYLKEVASAILAHLAGPKEEGPVRLYISRKKAGKRKIVNEDELESLLESYGFIIVCMEDLPYQEQVRLTAKASILVSLHGGGLTNMIFMKPGSSVLEFRQEGDKQNNCYYTMASDMGLDYYYVVCPQVNKEEISHTADVRIDIEQIRNVLVSMIGE